MAVAGTQSGTVSAFFREVLDIPIEPLGVWDAQIDGAVRQLTEIEKTLPTNKDSVGTDPNTLPVNMPKSLPKPKFGNSVEMIQTSGGGWPFVSYCRPSNIGSSSQNKQTCSGAVHVHFFVGRGLVQWIGMDWIGGTEDASSGWTKVLARAIQGSACTEGRRVSDEWATTGNNRHIID